MAKRSLDGGYWTRPELIDLEPDTLLLNLYLEHNLHASPSGVYSISRRVVEFESHLDGERVERAMNTLVERELIRVDHARSVIWHRAFFGNHANSPRFAIAAINQIAALNHPEFTPAWFAEHADTLRRFGLTRKSREAMRDGAQAQLPIPEPDRVATPYEGLFDGETTVEGADERVFKVWVESFGYSGRGLSLTDKRRKAICARLKKHTEQEVSDSIRGWATDPWRHGQFRDGSRDPECKSALNRNDIAKLLRNEDQYEAGLMLFQQNDDTDDGADPLIRNAEREMRAIRRHTSA